MPPALQGLLDPAHTAVITSECQEGIIGKRVASGRSSKPCKVEG